MITCPICGIENSLMNEKCTRCGKFLGYPNVNDCSRKEERDALEKRYREKVKWANSKGYGDHRIEFEKQLNKCMAVINIDLENLYHFILSKHSLLSNYQSQTIGRTRDYARSEFDKKRLGVEGTLFGNYGKEIQYAALSMDGSGLSSYGDFTLILSNDAIEARSTLLEENSYSFTKKHKILAGGTVPPGYRAQWKDRHKLATAKLIEKIVLTKRENYCTIVLDDTGNREKDDFIEIHIYGSISKEAIQAVRESSGKTTEDYEKIALMKRALMKNKKKWIKG